MAIGSNTNTLSFDDVVSSLLSEEMVWKNMEVQNIDALFARSPRKEEVMCTWILKAHMHIMRHGWLTLVHPFI